MRRISVLAVLALCSRLAAEEPAPPSTEPAPAPAPEAPPAPADAPTDAPTDAPPAEPEHTPAALAADPVAEAPAAPASSSTPSTPPPAAAVSGQAKRRVGDPVPLTRREPTVGALGFMVGIRYGLVGTGPTRFVDDIRFGITDTIELRTALLPYPSSLMLRARFGSQQSDTGAILVDAGLAHWDAGLRIVPDTGESQVGMRFHLEGGVGYARALGERFAVTGQAHYRYRASLLEDDDQHAVAVDGHLTYDLLDSLAVSAGLGFASTIGGPVRELSVNFVETDAPGMSHLLARDEGGEQSLTIPLTLTYGRVENFDVDLFCTPRVWPELGMVFGAGLRLRLDPFKS
jgi:hypothetical protein